MPKKGKGKGKGKKKGMSLDEFLISEENKAPPPTQESPQLGSGAESDFPTLPSLSAAGSSNDFPQMPSPNDTGRGRGMKRETQMVKVHDVTQPECNKLGLPEQLDKLTISEVDMCRSKITVQGASSSSDPDRDGPSGFQTTNCKWAVRPNFGKAGRPIALVSNYFNTSCKTNNIYHYDIEINSLDHIKKYGITRTKKTAHEAAEANISRIEHQLDRNIGKVKCREVFDMLIKRNNWESFNPVYDGAKNIFTSKPLPFEVKQTFTVESEVNGKTRIYEVHIKPVKKANGGNVVDVKSLLQNYEGQNELVTALNSIMNHRDPPVTQVQLGRSFFFLNCGKKLQLGEGLEIWFGYNQSIHWTQKGPSVVINLSAKTFHKAGSIINYVNELLGRDLTRGDPMNYRELTKLEEVLKGVKVTVTHLAYKRKYTIIGVSKESAQNLNLSYDGIFMTVLKYFESKYGRVKYPHLPCLQMRAKNNQTYIPFENCMIIEGQPFLGKLNNFLNGKMIKATAIPPDERFRAIHQSARDAQKESSSKMKNYNIFMDLEPRKISGRVIAAPAVRYANASERAVVCNPDNRGVWQMEGKSLFKPNNGTSWVVLSFSQICDMNTLHNFADVLQLTGKKIGLTLGRLLDIKMYGRNDRTEQVLFEAQKTKASFALIVLSKTDKFHHYDEIKFIADYKLGFVTQCTDEKVVRRFSDQIAMNLCLKLNTKLGGVNHILLEKPKILSKPVMILGADAVHSPRGSGCPSIAAVVGSMDAYPSKYQVACRVQDNPDGNKISQEVILEMKSMVKSLLNSFYHFTNGKYPEKIIFFRDGVSEGQFQAVRDLEVNAIQLASQEIIGCVIPITFIIVQKRHQTRLKPVNQRDGVGRAYNIPPGTTVDNDITHPDHFDYFLNSHEGIQGTNKPAHYTVLHDDNGFDADELQKLSYNLCFTYGKCNHSISIPVPVQYADRACYRAKKYADFHLQQGRETGSSHSSDSGSRLPDHARDAINTMEHYKTSMFFV